MKQSDYLKNLDSSTEKSVRIQLAAVCRLLEHFGWSDAILNHASARVPESPDNFLMNPFGLMYSEVTASNLTCVDFLGNNVDETGWPVNQAGVVLHSAIYQARPDIKSIIHTHTPYGVAVSSLACGLKCNDQMGFLFHDCLGYHDFSGVVFDDDEREAVASAIAKNKCLILRNHGLVATGASVAECFWNYYYLEFACKVQILGQSTGEEFYKVASGIKDKTFEQHEEFCKKEALTNSPVAGNHDIMLRAMMRMLERDGQKFSF